MPPSNIFVNSNFALLQEFPIRFPHCLGPELAEGAAKNEVALGVEGVVDGSVGGQEALCVGR